jgi:hypothetical protein
MGAMTIRFFSETGPILKGWNKGKSHTCAKTTV